MLVATAALFVRTLRPPPRSIPDSGPRISSSRTSMSRCRDFAGNRPPRSCSGCKARLRACRASSRWRGADDPAAGQRLRPRPHPRARATRAVAATDDSTSDWDVVTPEYFDDVRHADRRGPRVPRTDRAGLARGRRRQRDLGAAVWPGRRRSAASSCNRNSDTEERGRDRGRRARREVPLHQRPPAPFVFVPMAQQPIGNMTLFVRHAPGRAAGAALRARDGTGRAQRAVCCCSRSTTRSPSGCCRSTSPRGSPAASAWSASAWRRWVSTA